MPTTGPARNAPAPPPEFLYLVDAALAKAVAAHAAMDNPANVGVLGALRMSAPGSMRARVTELIDAVLFDSLLRAAGGMALANTGHVETRAAVKALVDEALVESGKRGHRLRYAVPVWKRILLGAPELQVSASYRDDVVRAAWSLQDAFRIDGLDRMLGRKSRHRVDAAIQGLLPLSSGVHHDAKRHARVIPDAQAREEAAAHAAAVARSAQMHRAEEHRAAAQQAADAERREAQRITAQAQARANEAEARADAAETREAEAKARAEEWERRAREAQLLLATVSAAYRELPGITLADVSRVDVLAATGRAFAELDAVGKSARANGMRKGNAALSTRRAEQLIDQRLRAELHGIAARVVGDSRAPGPVRTIARRLAAAGAAAHWLPERSAAGEGPATPETMPDVAAVLEVLAPPERIRKVIGGSTVPATLVGVVKQAEAFVGWVAMDLYRASIHIAQQEGRLTDEAILRAHSGLDKPVRRAALLMLSGAVGADTGHTTYWAQSEKQFLDLTKGLDDAVATQALSGPRARNLLVGVSRSGLHAPLQDPFFPALEGVGDIGAPRPLRPASAWETVRTRQTGGRVPAARRGTGPQLGR